MRKVCKIILIILFYVFMFWGLVNGVKSVLHKTNKCNCNCDKTEKVVEVMKKEPMESIKIEVKENAITKTVDNEAKKTSNNKLKKTSNNKLKKTSNNKIKKTSNNKIKKTSNNKIKKTISKTTKSNIKKVSNKKVSKSDYKKYAHDLIINTYKWSEADYSALVKLWNKESGWNPNSHNSSSGAHGIPQALPASKMKSEGSDYYTNGYTQIRWGLKYIKNRYGTPSKAWRHFQNKNWY